MLSTQPLGLQEEEAMSWAHLLKVPDGVLECQMVTANVDSKRATDPVLVPRVYDGIFQCKAQRCMDIGELIPVF